MPIASIAMFDPGNDLAACRRLLGDGSRSFQAASRLLPREVARAACALYAFCRVADDCVDREYHSDTLTKLHERLDRIYAGAPQEHVADRAFAAVVAHYQVPQAWPRALLDGFAWDAQGRQYEDISQLRAYAARVAGSVGAMMACVMGVRSRAALARACELGVAMQLTNIARDVGEDARMGRLYLPRAWMREAGIDPDSWLAQPAFNPALGTVVARILDEARNCYQGAAAGFASLPLSCRPGIRAAALLYAEIGHVVQHRGFDSVGGRAYVGPGRKAQLVSWAALRSLAVTFPAAAPPPREIDFLLEAAAALEASQAVSSIHKVLDLFERLERRDRGFDVGLPVGATPAAQA